MRRPNLVTLVVAALIFIPPFIPGQLKIEAVVEVTFSLSR
jgi:hypothetical protein